MADLISCVVTAAAWLALVAGVLAERARERR